MVKEKSHKSCLDALTASRYFVRLAKKFSDDYDFVFGKGKAAENADLQKAIGLICDGKEFEEVSEEWSDSYDSLDGYTVKYTKEWRFIAVWEDDKYILDYYFLSTHMYEHLYFGVLHTGNEYSDIRRDLYRQKGAYRYFCNQRPPSPGGIPPGYVTYETYRNSQKDGEWCPGEVTYNEQLTEEQMTRYGLEIDEGWTTERNAYAYGIYED